MVKIVSYDYKALVGFISDYSLSSSITQPEYQVLLSRIHKKYYALLLFLSEMQREGFSAITSSHKLDVPTSEFLINYTKETLSDLGTALFSWIHGLYKSSYILTRSSIENSIRAISILDDSTICGIAFSNDLFERARQLPIFLNDPARSYLSFIKGDYSYLCAYVHTSNFPEMAKISALNNFPVFECSSAKDAAEVITRVTQRILVLQCSCYRDFLFNMHYSNRDYIISSLPREVRKDIIMPP